MRRHSLLLLHQRPQSDGRGAGIERGQRSRPLIHDAERDAASRLADNRSVKSTGASGARRRLALAAALLAALGVGVAAYLTYEKLSGVVGPCIVGSGCDTVNSSPYSSVFGIPTAAYGLLWSTIGLVAALAWRRTADRRPLYVLYTGGLVGVLVEAYLVYLQLFVIRAVCSWCVLYGATVVIGWLVAVVGMAVGRTSTPDS
jgi:uncharacterized membrane protein